MRISLEKLAIYALGQYNKYGRYCLEYARDKKRLCDEKKCVFL
jgi:hypothetical protein